MTIKQSILDALNGKIKRPELLEALGIVGEAPNYHYKRQEREKKAPVIPRLEEVKEFFKLNGYSEAGAIAAYKYYEDGNWTDAKGNPVLNWKQKMRGNQFREEYRIKPTVYKTLNL